MPPVISGRASSAPRQRTAKPFCPPSFAVKTSGSVRVHTPPWRSEEHTSEHQSLMRTSYAAFCLKKKKDPKHQKHPLKAKHNPPIEHAEHPWPTISNRQAQ